MEKVINTLIFDCFGVVCGPVLNGWYTDNRVKHGFVDTGLEEMFGRFDLGYLSEEDIAEHFSKYEGMRFSKEEIMRQIDGYLKLDHDLVKLIQKIKDTGFKTALLSNANASFFERMVYKTYPEFKNLFDEIVISSSVGMVKPNRDIYEYALRKLDSKPEESLFVDDSKVNVEAAKNLGMYGFVYTDVNSFTRHIQELRIIDPERTLL